MTFSIYYISSVTGVLIPIDPGYRRDQLRAAFDSFRWYANSNWAAASSWILKRGHKTIAHKPTPKAPA